MLTIRGIEVTQGIQYYRADQHLTDPNDRGPDNSLALVANKPAWVRVYVETDAAGSIPNVTGTLEVDYGFLNERAGQPGVTLNPQPPGQVTAQFNPDYATTRASTALTLNFIIPADRMYGPLGLKASVTDGGNHNAAQDLWISASLRQTLKLRGIMIGYNGPDPNNPGSNLVLAAPGLADLQATAGWALRVMPIQSNAVFEVASTLTRNTPLTGTATNGGCATGWLNLNTAIATAQTADGNHPGYLYYGLIATGFPNQSNNSGCESSGVSSGFNGGQVALAHEIGHACGRPHAPCGGVGTSADPNYPAYEPYDTPAARVASIGEYGLDITNGNVPTPNSARDYMSYCGPRWISIYTHQALTNNDALNPEQVGVRRPWWKDYVAYDPWWWLHYIPDPPPYWVDPESIREVPWRMQKVISVIGLIHADDSIEVVSVTRSEVMSTELAGRTSELRAVLLGSKGAELASSPIVEMPSSGSCGCKNGQGRERPVMFQSFVPDVALGSALSIRRGTDTVWKRTAPKGKLTVTPPKFKPCKDSSILEVEWKAAIHGEAAEAWVRVSADEGKTWRAAATGLAESRAAIDLAHLPAGKLLVEVAVHDGFRSVYSKPVAFENAPLPPVPAILNPYPGQKMVEGETLYLWGSVAVQPGQHLEDYLYEWSLDGKRADDGLHAITKVPRRGEHRLELAVMCKEGKLLGSCSVEFSSTPAEKSKGLR